VIWVLDHLADLRSDFSVFHRIDDIESMGSVRFFQMAYRITAYSGVMSSRQYRRAATGTGGGVAAAEPEIEHLGPLKADKIVESTPAALLNSDIGDMFSFGRG
jgi:hypothetical protein